MQKAHKCVYIKCVVHLAPSSKKRFVDVQCVREALQSGPSAPLRSFPAILQNAHAKRWTEAGLEIEVEASRHQLAKTVCCKKSSCSLAIFSCIHDPPFRFGWSADEERCEEAQLRRGRWSTTLKIQVILVSTENTQGRIHKVSLYDMK
jgi:hypothetical protein